MRIIHILTAGALTVAVLTPASAAMLPSSLSNLRTSEVTLVQAKDETVKQKVKRVYRNIVGTTYQVGCPSIAVAFTRTTCTETGKDAKAKCIARNPLCQVEESR